MDTKKLFGAIGLAVVAIVIAVIVMRPGASPLGERAGAVETVCAACGHVEVRTLSAVPDVCSECGKKQVYPAVKCPQCGAPNPLTMIAGPQGRAPQMTCRKCGHRFMPQMPSPSG